MLSRDPYLVGNWQTLKNLGMVSKLFWNHLNQEKFRQVCHWFWMLLLIGKCRRARWEKFFWRYLSQVILLKFSQVCHQGFGLSHDPFLVANWTVLKNLGVVDKLFWSHLNQEKEGLPGMSLISGFHVTPVLWFIGQFRRTWVWWENYSGVISIKIRPARYVIGFGLSRDLYLVAKRPILRNLGIVGKLFRSHRSIFGVISIRRKSARYVIGFMLSRDPYLVANWPTLKNLGVMRKLFQNHLSQKKVSQVWHLFQAVP